MLVSPTEPGRTGHLSCRAPVGIGPTGDHRPMRMQSPVCAAIDPRSRGPECASGKRGLRGSGLMAGKSCWAQAGSAAAEVKRRSHKRRLGILRTETGKSSFALACGR